MAFHWKDNWYFERLEDGSVVIEKRVASKSPKVWINIDPDSWASIVASVSARGETGETFREAREFHDKEPR